MASHFTSITDLVHRIEKLEKNTVSMETYSALQKKLELYEVWSKRVLLIASAIAVAFGLSVNSISNAAAEAASDDYVKEYVAKKLPDKVQESINAASPTVHQMKITMANNASISNGYLIDIQNSKESIDKLLIAANKKMSDQGLDLVALHKLDAAIVEKLIAGLREIKVNRKEIYSDIGKLVVKRDLPADDVPYNGSPKELFQGLDGANVPYELKVPTGQQSRNGRGVILAFPSELMQKAVREGNINIE